MDEICVDESTTVGDYWYTNNQYYGYGLVHVTETKQTIEMRISIPKYSEPKVPTTLESVMNYFIGEESGPPSISPGMPGYYDNDVLFTVELIRNQTAQAEEDTE